MAVIHRTTVSPTKLELLTEWLPTRPWYRGGPTPVLEKSGGFRLDDPDGEVGIEFMVVTDASGPEPTAYLVPLTYRGAPLAGAERALVGTMEHGVLGTRWAYDGCHDPVLVTESLALIEGRAQAQAQSLTDTPDHEVTRACTGGPLPAAVAPAPAADDDTGTRVPLPQGLTLHVHRVLDASAPTPPEDALGHVAGVWQGQDGERARAVLMVLRGA
ncbi:1,4-alpha-glucan branching protein [Streptomyces sp. NPDC047028]|uniref:maltokinase N-terminal cap-like domain-containing protein n=1 Tax=Streptomyces sp. NPDC047028 TaxID=3155793 RepID=UPI00340FF04E